MKNEVISPHFPAAFSIAVAALSSHAAVSEALVEFLHVWQLGGGREHTNSPHRDESRFLGEVPRVPAIAEGIGEDEVRRRLR